MAPPRPLQATPEPKNKEPVLPLLEVPVDRTRNPLPPLVPAFAVLNSMTPLLVAEL